ncbi:GIY-YIG nuclease family protein [Streptomyces sp. NPDC058045]|uniref:GIY-YIG nuclease family protein n=1 Tax=Streptomyces sp. NPDC058045 TaxID=3346311 RepID=UPI0036E459F6
MYLDDRRTALYRIYDASGVLLYVGITQNVEERWTAHERDKSWWPQVAAKTVEWFDTRPLALAAERYAVREESPVHNVTGKPWSATRRPLEAGERTVPQLRAGLTEHCREAASSGTAVTIVDRGRERRRVAVLVPYDFYERALEALDETAVPAVQ